VRQTQARNKSPNAEVQFLVSSKQTGEELWGSCLLKKPLKSKGWIFYFILFYFNYVHLICYIEN